MNYITIYYKRRDKNLFFELMRTINALNVGFNWNNACSEVKIYWEWNQKIEVVNLLGFLKKVFLDARIVMENSEEGIEVYNPLPKAEDIEEDSLQVEENIDMPKESVESFEATLECNLDENKDLAITEEVFDEETQQEQSSSAEADAKESDDQIDTLALNSDTNFDSSDNKADECNLSVEVPDGSDFANDSSMCTQCEESNISYSNSVETTSSEDLETLLNETFGEIVEKVGAEDCTKQEKIQKLLKELKMTSEILSLAMALTLSRVATVERIYGFISRKMRKNIALAKIELKKSFEKWIKAEYPNIVERYPTINVNDFLDIFGEYGSKL